MIPVIYILRYIFTFPSVYNKEVLSSRTILKFMPGFRLKKESHDVSILLTHTVACAAFAYTELVRRGWLDTAGNGTENYFFK
jgi:hypothetical protein